MTANIFVSSTHNDLRDVRGELATFLQDFGTAYLSSEEGFPNLPTLQPCVACLRTLEGCSLVIVIIDRRYGNPVADWTPYPAYDGLSPLHAEVRHALSLHTHMRVYVRDNVQTAFELFGPAVDLACANQSIEPGVFKLLHEIKESAPTPWIVKFDDVRDIKSDLEKYFKFVLGAGLDTLRGTPVAAESSPHSLGGSLALLPVNDETGMVEVRNLLAETVSKLENDKKAVFGSGDIVRLHLSTSAALSDLITGEILSANVMNEVHSRRDEIVPTASERRLLLRTLLSDRHDHLPGWWCWSRTSERELVTTLRSIAERDTSENVRTKAIDVLKTLAPDKALAGELLDDLSSVESEELKLAILGFAAESGDHDIRDRVEALEATTTGKLSGAIRHALARLSTPGGEVLLTFLASLSDEEVKGQEDMPRADIKAVDMAVLWETAPVARNEATFRSLVKELERRGADVTQILRTAVVGTAGSVAPVAIAMLLERGISVDLAEIERVASDDTSERRKLLKFEFALRPELEVAAELDFLSLTRGVAAYECLAARSFPVERVRRDLESDFDDLKKESVKKRASAIVPGVLQHLREKLPAKFADERQVDARTTLGIQEAAEESVRDIIAEHSQLYTDCFRASALRSLAVRPSPGDREIALRYLGESDLEVRSAAIALLRGSGHLSDVATLVEIAQAHAFHDVEAGDAAVALDAARAIPLLLQSESTRLTGLAIGYLIRERNDGFEEDVLRMLFNSSAGKRELACAYVVAMWTRERLLNALAAYQKQSLYYYNVVCWLDRALYAPAKIWEVFRRELRRLATPAPIVPGRITRMFRKI